MDSILNNLVKLIILEKVTDKNCSEIITCIAISIKAHPITKVSLVFVSHFFQIIYK